MRKIAIISINPSTPQVGCHTVSSAIGKLSLENNVYRLGVVDVSHEFVVFDEYCSLVILFLFEFFL